MGNCSRTPEYDLTEIGEMTPSIYKRLFYAPVPKGVRTFTGRYTWIEDNAELSFVYLIKTGTADREGKTPGTWKYSGGKYLEVTFDSQTYKLAISMLGDKI